MDIRFAVVAEMPTVSDTPMTRPRLSNSPNRMDPSPKATMLNEFALLS